MCLHAGIVGVLTCWDSGGAHVCLHAGIVGVLTCWDSGCAYMLG